MTIRTDVPWEVVLDARGNLILIEHGAKASVELSATSERNLKDLNVSLGGYRAFSVSVSDKGGAKGKS